MNGKLYGVSVGPGDPELMTLKAARVIRECPVVALPRSGAGEPEALQIARRAVPEMLRKEFLELDMPMTRDPEKLEEAHRNAAGAVLFYLRKGLDVAFLTLGDVSIYSTYGYLHERVRAAGFEAEMVAGVPSFCAAAARLGESLTSAEKPLHILPGSYEGLEEGLDRPGTKVLMKSGKALETVKEALRRRGLSGKAALVERCGMEGERVCRSLDQAGGAGYFSIIIVKD